MKKPAFVLTLAALAVAVASAFALERHRTRELLREERESIAIRVRKAVVLAREHPRAFGPRAAAGPSGPSSLKTLVQETGTKRSVTLGYLSENEREADAGRRERQVLVRLVNAGHANLVRFLEDLEQSGGARIKEIHVRPSREVPDAYEEAEIVLSKISSAEAKP